MSVWWVLGKTEVVGLLGDFWEAIAAGHVKRRPPFLIPLVDVSAVLHQELHTGQVASQNRLMNGCHACSQSGETHRT